MHHTSQIIFRMLESAFFCPDIFQNVILQASDVQIIFRTLNFGSLFQQNIFRMWQDQFSLKWLRQNPGGDSRRKVSFWMFSDIYLIWLISLQSDLDNGHSDHRWPPELRHSLSHTYFDSSCKRRFGLAAPATPLRSFSLQALFDPAVDLLWSWLIQCAARIVGQCRCWKYKQCQ